MYPDLAARRLSPRWWDHQWFLNRSLSKALKKVLDVYAQPRPGQVVVDIGCGRKPYQTLFQERGCKYIGCDIQGEVDVLVHQGQPLALGIIMRMAWFPFRFWNTSGISSGIYPNATAS